MVLNWREGEMGDIGQTEQEGCAKNHQQKEGAVGFPTEISTSRAGRHENVGPPTYHQVVRHPVH